MSKFTVFSSPASKDDWTDYSNHDNIKEAVIEKEMLEGELERFDFKIEKN